MNSPAPIILLSALMVSSVQADQNFSGYCNHEKTRLPVKFADHDGAIDFSYNKVSCKGDTAKQTIVGKAMTEKPDIEAITSEALSNLLESCKIDDYRIYLDNGMKIASEYQITLRNGVVVSFTIRLDHCGV